MNTLTINYNKLSLSGYPLKKDFTYPTEKAMEDTARMLIEDKFKQFKFEGIDIVGTPSEYSKFIQWLKISGHIAKLVCDKEWDWDDINYNLNTQRNQRIDKWLNNALTNDYITMLITPTAGVDKYRKEVLAKGANAIKYLEAYVNAYRSYGYDFTTTTSMDYLSAYKTKQGTINLSAKQGTMQVVTPCDLLKMYYSIRWQQEHDLAPLNVPMPVRESFSSYEIAEEFAKAKIKEGYTVNGIYLSAGGWQDMYEVEYMLDTSDVTFDSHALNRLLYGDDRED